MEQEMTGNVHMGRNVARFRRAKGMKQLTLGELLNISQQAISLIEQKPVIEDDLLEKIAKILEVPTNIIKTMPNDESSNIVIETNTFESVGTANIVPGNNNDNDNDYNNTYHPLEKMMEYFKLQAEAERKERQELMKQIKDLHEMIRKMQGD